MSLFSRKPEPEYTLKPHVAQFIFDIGRLIGWIRWHWLPIIQNIAWALAAIVFYGGSIYFWMEGTQIAKRKAQAVKIDYLALRGDFECTEVIHDETTGKLRLSDKCLRELKNKYIEKMSEIHEGY